MQWLCTALATLDFRRIRRRDSCRIINTEARKPSLQNMENTHSQMTGMPFIERNPHHVRRTIEMEKGPNVGD
jgi:hypothetical protein